MKKIPTDVDNFVTLREEGYYFFDKTQYIRTLERQKKFILLVRPRRMGKTLFSSLLMTYYDINYKERFQELFGDLNIGKDPTEWANKYLALRLDFSQFLYDPDNLEKNFSNYCFGKFKDFLDRYHEYYTEAQITDILTSGDIKSIITRLVDITHLKNHKIFLAIDEYDNFTNTVLSARGVKAHEAITHGEGFYRTFFSGLKGTFDRIFLTGVSPVTYDDLTSGFNIADMVSLMPWFDQSIGVTEIELREMIEYYRKEGAITCDTEDIIQDMKPWYDNFCFAADCYATAPTIYNTQMVLRYMRILVEHGTAPKPMIDVSARVDPAKLNFLVMSEDYDNRELRIAIIKEICAQGYTFGNVEEQFQAGEAGEENNFKSLLFSEPQEQSFLRGLLCRNEYFDVWPELELSDGFCDLLLVPKFTKDSPVRYSYLIELKHMGAKAKSPDAKIKEACKQLRQYISDAHLVNSAILKGTTLIPLYLIFQHNKLITKGQLK
ncbi:MAG: ATP-binding protein [Bacteroidales bacterium]|nr:ATP-binding protein [Bacteroidales bacterium]